MMQGHKNQNTSITHEPRTQVEFGNQQSTMVMETPGPQEVGREFVRQYYTMLNEAPLHLHRFYSNNSAFVHGGVEKAGNEQPPVVGQEAIHKKILSLGFNDCHAKIRQVDSQATVEDSVVVQVTGELSNNGEPMRRFMQTFVLVPQTPKKFYVHNDIFRYQDEVFHDDDGDPEETDRFVTDPRQEILENGSIPDPAPAVAQEVPSNYYDPVPLSNGTSHEVEALKTPEPAPAIVSTPPQAPKAEGDSTPSNADSGLPEEVSPSEEKFEQKVEPKPSPAPEPPQPEFSDPPLERKPVTWAALASKNPAGGSAPQAQSFPAPAASHVSKPPQVRQEPAKTEGIPTQAPQAQRPQRAPRDRYADRDRNSMSRGDGDGDNESVNGRRSNSAGGTKYSDRQQLFVGNLPLNITERELKEFFEQYGKVEELRINTKSGGGKLPNFGFVVFESPETVKQILTIKVNDGIKYNGEHRLNVEEKKPRINDGMRGGRGGMSRGGNMGGQGMGRSGPPYGGSGGPGGRGGSGGGGGMKNGGFGRQDMRGSPNLGPRGGMSQQGRR
ncbi:ras GTPase-activating protein-binding protein 2 isoform X1 [Aplysia californica]|uniref:Ras GTPase-activating protein-binding protein 2 isoform X1 n=2 Tax=Aplysia californica TaxID=6500 RepID=A0ABM0K6T1_APLCA|nr:ras GTPase-activating protein-binding protein 2 isoform X1 [Aplysia californica]